MSESSAPAPNAQSYVSRAGIKESPLDLARCVADKFIRSKPQTYYPSSKEEKYYPWLYPTGVALWAFCQVSDLSGDPKYLDYVQKSFDYYLAENKVVVRDMNDGGCLGHAMLELHRRRPDPRYRAAIQMITEYYEHRQPRLLDGSLCYHQEPERRRTWIDALFIVCPLLAKSAELLGQPQRYDDVLPPILQLHGPAAGPRNQALLPGLGLGRQPHQPLARLLEPRQRVGADGDDGSPKHNPPQPPSVEQAPGRLPGLRRGGAESPRRRRPVASTDDAS